MKSKKNFKLISLFLLLVTVMSFLTGCLRSGVGITINGDDTGQVELSFGISKDYYRIFPAEYGTELYGGRDTTEINEDGTTYICVSEKKEFKSLEELQSILTNLQYTSDEMDSLFSSGMEEYGVTGSGSDETDTRIFSSADIQKSDNFFGRRYQLQLVTNAVASEDTMTELPDFATDNIYRVHVDITLPGKIKAEGAVVTGNTASFTLTELREENTLCVESNEVNTVRIIAVIIATVCLVLLISMFIDSAKKNPAKTWIESEDNEL